MKSVWVNIGYSPLEGSKICLTVERKKSNMIDGMFSLSFCFCFVLFFVFLGPHPWHTEVPRLGVSCQPRAQQLGI